MRRSIPKTGIGWPEIQAELAQAQKKDVDWRHGRLSGMVYFADDDVLQVTKDAYSMFFSENMVALHAFPSLERLEREVVEMASVLLNGDESVTGSMSSGGTESIFLAMKAARDWARDNRPTKGTPEIVVARTAHPAFNKSAHFLDLKVIRVPQGPDFRADVDAMGEAITENTIVLVGSAPAYPHGVIDPIAKLGELAQARGLWLHVDSCVGGYLAHWVRELGYPVPDFDFSVPGVTSISADLHKHGYAAKGASTVLFRNADYAKYHGFEFDDWARGHYSTSTFTGTRSGGGVAAAWAVLNYLGEDGYLRLAREVMQAKEALINGVRSIDGLETWGDPELSIFTFGSRSFDIFAVADVLAEAGWVPNRLTEPPGIHHLITPVHLPVVEEYLSDLAYAVEKARSGKTATPGAKVSY